MRTLHVVHLLIRQNLPEGKVGFLVYPHEHWRDAGGTPYLALPAKKTVADPLAEFIQGTPLHAFVDEILKNELGLPDESYVLERELEPVEVKIASPTTGLETDYWVFPVDIWVAPDEREQLRRRMNGQWLTCGEAKTQPQVSPTAMAALSEIEKRHERYKSNPPAEKKPAELQEDNLAERRKAEDLRRVFDCVPDQASMDALATKWLSESLHGVRHLSKQTLDAILDAGDRAFNLRVADPYLRYQMQGLGFTWSFFTDKDRQDVHVHGAPVVEIYGIIEGRLEVWWKPYYERGTSAWCHRILEAGDWLEVDALQCHFVHWLGTGKGVVFKAGPGPLAEVGKLGVKGKTPCKDCPCMKPPRVVELS